MANKDVRSDEKFDQADPAVEAARIRMMRAVLDGLEPLEVISLLAAQLKTLGRVDRCAVFVRAVDSQPAVWRVVIDGHGAHHATKVPVSIDQVAPWCSAASDKATTILNVAEAPGVAAFLCRARMADAGAIATVPMIFNGELVGVAVVGDQHTYDASNTVAVANMAAFLRLATHILCVSEAMAEHRQQLVTVDKERQALQRTSTLVEHLERLLVRGEPLTAYTSLLARALNRPVVVHDAQARIRAHDRGPAQQDVTRWLVDGRINQSTQMRKAIGSMRTHGVQLVQPDRTAGVSLRCLVAPVAIGGDHWGHVTVAEYGHPFSQVDERMLAKAASYIALSMTTESPAATNARDIRTSLASDLLHAAGTPDRLQRRAVREGIDAPAYRVCLVATDCPPDPLWVEELESAIATCLMLSSPVLACSIDGGLALIVPSATPAADVRSVNPINAAITAAITAVVGKECLVAMSSAINSVADLGQAYCEARQVLRCMRRYPARRRPHVMTASDLGASLVFLASSDVAENDAFARGVLGELFADVGVEDLVRTLHTFLVASRKVRKCALVLGVHENTVRYRLGRIHQICNLDIMSDSSDQTRAELALLVMRLNGTCPWDPLTPWATKEAGLTSLRAVVS